MQTGDNASRLRIYISSTDKYEHTPLYETIVYAARKKGLAGATVIKGIMGYGASSEVFSTKLWEISEKLPLVVEIIDKPHKIENFLESIKPFFEKAGKGYIITIDDIKAVYTKKGGLKNHI